MSKEITQAIEEMDNFIMEKGTDFEKTRTYTEMINSVLKRDNLTHAFIEKQVKRFQSLDSIIDRLFKETESRIHKAEKAIEASKPHEKLINKALVLSGKEDFQDLLSRINQDEDVQNRRSKTSGERRLAENKKRDNQFMMRGDMDERKWRIIDDMLKNVGKALHDLKLALENNQGLDQTEMSKHHASIAMVSDEYQSVMEPFANRGPLGKTLKSIQKSFPAYNMQEVTIMVDLAEIQCQGEKAKLRYRNPKDSTCREFALEFANRPDPDESFPERETLMTTSASQSEASSDSLNKVVKLSGLERLQQVKVSIQELRQKKEALAGKLKILQDFQSTWKQLQQKKQELLDFINKETREIMTDQTLDDCSIDFE